MSEPLRVDVVMGGPGREAAVSRRSGVAIARALAARGHDVTTIDIAAALDVRQLRPGSIVFNIVHGTYGEDGTLQRLLEQHGVPFVGSDSAASALCMDKAASKRRLQEAGLRVPWGIVIDLGAAAGEDLAERLAGRGPLIMKPADDGSSVGLRLVEGACEALDALPALRAEFGPRRYLIEERLPGPEYTVAVIDDDRGPRALPPLFIRPAGGVFDYDAKYHRHDTIEAPVEEAALARRLSALALAAYRACGCRDLARIDIMAAADGELAVLELNTLPGFTDASLTPKAAAAAGISFADLVEHLVRRAAARTAPP
ncbi:MAG: D-alanine--D-alanine ligase [Planctomycetota bacterium]|nr:D-alanine--D-alanine ligase [Planctomycetota bacterium]